MLISDIKEKLEDIKRRYGDVPVCLRSHGYSFDIESLDYHMGSAHLNSSEFDAFIEDIRAGGY